MSAPSHLSKLLVPAEAVALCVRAFGEPHRAMVSRMHLPELMLECQRALYVLVGTIHPGATRFAVDDIIMWSAESSAQPVQEKSDVDA